MRTQTTIAHPVSISGRGYWSGNTVRVEFRPASVDTGIVFVRSDLRSPVRIPASVDHRIEIPRRTSLEYSNHSVDMIEHVMAAVAGLGISNCEVWVDQAEMPACDGSSLPFVKALNEAGAVAQSAAARVLVISQVVRVGDDACWVEARPGSTDALKLHYELDYGAEHVIGRQDLAIEVTPTSFINELASARTFLTKQEADWLLSQGLGKHVTMQDLLVFDERGPLGNRLRFADECVRHKTLDLVGDLALAGCQIVGEVHAHRSGHRLNAELVQELLQQEAMIQARRKSA